MPGAVGQQGLAVPIPEGTAPRSSDPSQGVPLPWPLTRVVTLGHLTAEKPAYPHMSQNAPTTGGGEPHASWWYTHERP
jgi:hypothetical protein